MKGFGIFDLSSIVKSFCGFWLKWLKSTKNRHFSFRFDDVDELLDLGFRLVVVSVMLDLVTLAHSFIWGISLIWQFSRSFSSIVFEYSRCKFWWFSCRNKSLSTSSLLFRINSSRSHSDFGYRGTQLRQVSGTKYLNQMNTYHLPCGPQAVGIVKLRRLDDSSSQTRIHSTYLS